MTIHDGLTDDSYRTSKHYRSTYLSISSNKTINIKPIWFNNIRTWI